MYRVTVRDILPVWAFYYSRLNQIKVRAIHPLKQQMQAVSSQKCRREEHQRVLWDEEWC